MLVVGLYQWYFRVLRINTVEVFRIKLHITEETKRTGPAKSNAKLGTRRYSRIIADCASRNAIRRRSLQVGNWAVRPRRRTGLV